MSEIEPGDGWRLLGPDEPVKFADEYLSKATGCWHPMTKDLYGWKANCFIAVRRRIPAKPQAMEIETERGLVTLQVYEPPVSVWISQMLGEYPEDVRLDTTEQIRQVISWLQQAADWREAQEEAK